MPDRTSAPKAQSVEVPSPETASHASSSGEAEPQRPATIGEVVGRLSADVAGLDRELAEIDLLVTQARSEAARHEERRAAAAAKLAAATAAADGAVAAPDAKAPPDQTAQLITLTKRAALMESQVNVLEGKRRALGRYRDALATYGDAIGSIDQTAVPRSPTGDDPSGGGGTAPGGVGTPRPADGADAPMSRIVLAAQEDLRREIARAMHDGPAQSLTNIVLQAQIVERLVERDPALARGEVRQLVAMVQQTLDATKSFIFDVRPMVLDDLGLTPTLRRAARERGRRAGIPVEFETMGQDQRLPMDVESGLFRMLDEALAAYLGAGPGRVTLALDWGDHLEARIVASHRDDPSATAPPPATKPSGKDAADLPPALAAMIEDRRADERDAAEAARRSAVVALSGTVWRDVQARAAALNMNVELLQDGAELRVGVDLPPRDSSGA